jgi:growth arrest-specific protein 2
VYFAHSWAQLLSAAARSSAQPGSFHSRDNISQFLSWCRRQLLIPDTLLFETEDLVLRKNEKSVIFCLVEVARRAVRRCGFPSAPQLIRLEEEIDEELAQEALVTKTTSASHQPRKPVIHVDMMSLDEMVRLLWNEMNKYNLGVYV